MPVCVNIRNCSFAVLIGTVHCWVQVSETGRGDVRSLCCNVTLI